MRLKTRSNCTVPPEVGLKGRSWSPVEVEALVEDYFDMLASELRHQGYNKAAHNAALQEMLDGRSHGSIERKHQNVSAILLEEGWPFIDGYKPLGNYQGSLRQAVLDRLARATPLRQLVELVSSSVPELQPVLDYADPAREVGAPEPVVREGPVESRAPATSGSGAVDFSERDAANRRLGELGEQFVLEVEKRRLLDAKRPDLAKQVLWASHEKGDGLGYDIESFDGDGRPIVVEVKTTNMGLRFPFLISRNEVRISEERAASYRLCRVFRFAQDARFFVLKGAVNRSCWLTPKTYIARV